MSFIKDFENRKKLIDVMLDDLSLKGSIDSVAQVLVESLEKGGKIIFFGNGGSATFSEHMVAEFVGRYKQNRNAYPAITLNSNIANLTAISNDFAYENVFSRQLEALARENDVVIGVSTSGYSKNVLNALEKANENSIKTVLMCGEKYNQGIADYIISVPTNETPHIQEAHLMIGHYLADFCEKNFVGLKG